MADLSGRTKLEPARWIGVAGALTRDPISVVGLIALALITSLYLLPVVSPQRLATWSEGPIFLPLMAWVVLATLVRSRRSRSEPERQFWRIIGIGSVCWFAATLLTLLPVWSADHALLELAYDGLVVTFYLALILATTKTPHVAAGPRRYVGATPVLLGTVVFGVGMTIYFDLVPYLVDRVDFESRAPAFYLFLALDLSLVARTAAQFRSARAEAWRIPYLLILLASLLLALGDLLDLLRRLGLPAYTSGTATDFLWYSIYASIALAAGLRQAEIVARPGRAGTERTLRHPAPHLRLHRSGRPLRALGHGPPRRAIAASPRSRRAGDDGGGTAPRVGAADPARAPPPRAAAGPRARARAAAQLPNGSRRSDVWREEWRTTTTISWR